MSSAASTEGSGAALAGWVGGAMLVAVTLAVYGQIVGFELFRTWDDGLYALQRETVLEWLQVGWDRRLLTPEIGYPIPVPTAVYAAVHSLPERWVVPALHTVNLAVQVANVLLAKQVANRWLRSARAGFVVALLWAVHPLLVESVAWVSNLKTLAFGTAVLGALWIWERHLDEPSVRRSVAVASVMLIALGCRPEGVVLPVVLGARMFFRRDVEVRRWEYLVPLAFGLAVGGLYLAHGLRAHRSLVSSGSFQFSVYAGYDMAERLRRIFAAIGLHAAHTFVPVGLHPSYFPGEDLLGTWWPVGVIVLAAAIGAGIWSWRERRRLLWGLLFAALLYAPVSGVEYLPRFTADTYVYLPLLGVVVALVAWVRHLLVTHLGEHRRAVMMTAAGIAVVFAGLSFVQTSRWRSTETLFSYAVEQSPQSPKSYHILARDYLRQEKWSRAAAVYRLGWDVFYERGFVDLVSLRTIARAGKPKEALRSGLRLYDSSYPVEPPDGLGALLLGVLVEHDLEWPGDATDVAFDAFARGVLERYRDSWSGARLIATARRLKRMERDELAEEYAVAALHREPSSCDIWRGADAIGVPVMQRSLPDRPEDCSGR